MSEHTKGGCACGAIRYEATGAPAMVARCHCLDCQKACGASSLVLAGFSTDNFKITQGTTKAFAYPGDSGKGLRRNFCADCGSRLFTSDLGLYPGMVFVTLGSMDGPKKFEPQMDIYMQSAQPYEAKAAGASFPAMPS